MDRSHFTDDDPADGADLDHASEPQLSVGDTQRSKTRLLSRQCATCIFRPGNPMHLDPGRLRDIVEQVRNGSGYIICHDTLPHYRKWAELHLLQRRIGGGDDVPMLASCACVCRSAS
jgi:hypothetical protein